MTFPLPGANWSYLHGLRLLATTGINGFALQNGTPNILTWQPPNDGNMHRLLLVVSMQVTSAETGGAISVNYALPNGNAAGHTLFSAGQAVGNPLPAQILTAQTIGGMSPVTLAQSSALTAGAATLWAEIWGS
jgi:hypothetical protein